MKKSFSISTFVVSVWFVCVADTLCQWDASQEPGKGEEEAKCRNTETFFLSLLSLTNEYSSVLMFWKQCRLLDADLQCMKSTGISKKCLVKLSGSSRNLKVSVFHLVVFKVISYREMRF